MDKRYEVFCLADPWFYEQIARNQNAHVGFEAEDEAIPDGWERTELGDWVVYWPQGTASPPQGWKIHVSACLDNAAPMLATVRGYCVERRVPFKFRRDRHALLLANAKYAPRGSSGKFITIYPRDDAQLESVLTELGVALRGNQGPYILSDLRWEEGPLYVRYGGFAERRCLSDSGALVLAIEDPDGNLVPDRRDPAFRPPAWVPLPEFLRPHLAARKNVTVDSLPYRIERVLHFSNAGGLYVGREARTDELVVLKEARPHAGLDVDGSDAITRLRREHDNLERLAGLAAVPAVYGRYDVGGHEFLAMEFVETKPLRAAIVDRYPLAAADVDPDVVADYTTWALTVQRRVEQAVASVHERGVVIGDVHPYNVLLRPDDSVVLIDFEAAVPVEKARKQTLANPGFVAPRDRTGFDIDRYALACMRLFHFLPLTVLLALDRHKAEDLAAVIAEIFPVPEAFLAEAVETITGRPGSSRATVRRRLDRLDPDAQDWESIRSAVAGAILESATPERDDRLFPGDIEQFDSGGLNLAHGAAGVLYALEVTGCGRFPDHEEWLVQRAVSTPPETTRLGLYDGLHGVAYGLEHLGYRAEALKVLDICQSELEGRWERLGLDLVGGLAGIGLNLAHFLAATGEPTLRESLLTVADIVADRLGTEADVGTRSGGKHPHAGLMRGSAGVALLFVQLYEQFQDPTLLDLAHTALVQDLRRCVTQSDGGLHVNEGWRTMPYLCDGSVGIGMVLDRYLAHREDERFATAATAIRRAAQSPFYVEPGLFHGRAGMILYLSRTHQPATAVRHEAVAAQVRRLAWHAIDYRGHPAFPGEELLRLSMDLATGNAGVLLALGAAMHPDPVHLPFLAPTEVSRPQPGQLVP